MARDTAGVILASELGIGSTAGIERHGANSAASSKKKDSTSMIEFYVDVV